MSKIAKVGRMQVQAVLCIFVVRQKQPLPLPSASCLRISTKTQRFTKTFLARILQFDLPRYILAQLGGRLGEELPLTNCRCPYNHYSGTFESHGPDRTDSVVLSAITIAKGQTSLFWISVKAYRRSVTLKTYSSNYKLPNWITNCQRNIVD